MTPRLNNGAIQTHTKYTNHINYKLQYPVITVSPFIDALMGFSRRVHLAIFKGLRAALADGTNTYTLLFWIQSK